MNEFQFVEIAVPLLFSLWVFRELWGFFLRPRAASDVAPPLTTQPVDRTDYLIAVTLAVTFYLVALWRLGTPDKQYFDEIYHARSGMEYAAGLNPHEWTHPPLAKLIIAGSIVAWRGEFDAQDGAWNQDTRYAAHTAFAWRYPSVVFGSGILVALFALGRTLFGNRALALTAACLMACDGIFFVESRMAMTNTFTVFFVLLGTIGTWQFFRRSDPRWLLLTGLGLGLALATRWSTLWAWGMTGLALLWHLTATLYPRWVDEKRDCALPLLRWAGMVTLAMFVIPVVIYLLSYIPFVLQGPGPWHEKLFSADANQHGWHKVITLQHDMWAYHSGIKEKHPYSSPWWSWPLMLRPVWYYYETGPDGMVSGVWAIGNAFIWWASVPAFLCAIVLALRQSSAALGLIALLGLGQWLPWGIEPRSLIFMHYYYETLPFACLALAYFGHRLWTSGSEARRAFAACYATAIVCWLIFYYPLLTALPVSESYYRLHQWLGRAWI